MSAFRPPLAVLAVSLGFLIPGAAGAASLERQLEPLARRVMDTALTPGMSVAVVREGRVVWQAGFGEADRENKRPVAPETRFYIGSTSKALTALAFARLAARGELDLDAPLARRVPAARFAPGVAADSITLRRLLTHTHGLLRQGPFTWRVTVTGEYTDADLFAALAGHPPAREGRVFTYSNLGYEIAALALAPGNARGWSEVVEREVLVPLGMTATTARVSKVPPALRAEPYDTGAEGVARTGLFKSDANMGPAGGHFSTAPDLARLVVAELNGGKVKGKRAIEPAVIAETQRLQATQTATVGPFQRHGWGLGWDLGTYGADTMITRSGSIEGYRCHVSFLPGRRTGVVVLVNGGLGASGVTDALAAAIYDRLAGRDSVEALLDRRLATVVESAARRRASLAADLQRRAARPAAPARPLDAYAGVFENPLLGTVEIAVRAGRLTARTGAAESLIEVFDLEKEMLRAEFMGSGMVLEMRFDGGAGRATGLRMLDHDFARRP